MNQSPALRDVRLSNVSMASLPGCGGQRGHVRGGRRYDGIRHLEGGMNQSPALRDVRLSNVSMASLPGCGGRGDMLEGGRRYDGIRHIGGYEPVAGLT